MRRGLVHIYTGSGKGKTTAALGLALRTAGHGQRVFIGQFCKGVQSGEHHALRTLGELVVIEQFGTAWSISASDLSSTSIQSARDGLERCRQVLESGQYHLVVLDEINVAVAFGALGAEQVKKILDARAPWVEVVLTGRYAPRELLDNADLVTEMVKVKHYFDEGVRARKGIEL